MVDLDLDLAYIISKIKNDGFCLIENFIKFDAVNKARSEYFSSMDILVKHPQGEKFLPQKLNAAPWRKLAIGSKSGSGESYSQVLQTTYFSQNDSNYPALINIFNVMIKIRNNLTGMRDDYGSDLSGDEFWNACRVHHYPKGGGHMASHRDTLFPKLLGEFEIPFVQIMVTLSERERDFNSGGGYIQKNDGDKFFFESSSNEGSLVLFDGSTIHGVDDVDSNKVIDFDSNTGRIALFVNLYENKSK